MTTKIELLTAIEFIQVYFSYLSSIDQNLFCLSMKRNSITFFNLHLSDSVKLVIAGIITIFLLFIFIYLSFWKYTIVLISVFMVYIEIHWSTITIDPGYKTSKLKIRTLHDTVLLEAPLHYTGWWNYEFKNEKEYYPMEGTLKTRPSSNIIKVYVQISDSTGRQCTFEEKIVFGTRFPNEVPYNPETSLVKGHLFKMQRVDKLIQFLDPLKS